MPLTLCCPAALMEFHEWYILLGFPELQLKKKNLCHSYFDINAKKKKKRQFCIAADAIIFFQMQFIKLKCR